MAAPLVDTRILRDNNETEQLRCSRQSYPTLTLTLSYTTAISACAQPRSDGEVAWQHALDLLADMRGHGVLPNIKTYSAAMLACHRAKVVSNLRTIPSHMIP